MRIRRGLSYHKLCVSPRTSFFPRELSHFACLDEQLGLGTTKVSEYQDPYLMYSHTPQVDNMTNDHTHAICSVKV